MMNSAVVIACVCVDGNQEEKGQAQDSGWCASECLSAIHIKQLGDDSPKCIESN